MVILPIQLNLTGKYGKYFVYLGIDKKPFMQRKSLFGLMAVALVLIVGCGTGDKSAVAIPKDAGLVIHINTPSLTSKLSWKEIQETNWFKEAYNEVDDSLAQKVLGNPEASGINTEVPLVFFVKRQGKNAYVVFEGALKDAAAFEAFNKQMRPKATGSKDGDLNILKLESKFIATWKDNRFAYVGADDMGYAKYDADGGSNTPSVNSDSLVTFAKVVYDLKGDNSLTSDDRFSSLLKEKGDAHLWLSSDNFTGDMLGEVFAATKLSDLTRGNISAATLNFDNGKIEMQSSSYYNNEMGKLLDKYKMKHIDGDMLARIPSENIAGVFTWNYPPEGLKEFLKIGGLDGMTNGFLGKVGYSLDEFVKANKGDVLIAASDYTLKTEQVTIPSYEEGGAPYTYTKSSPSVKVLFAVSINDKPAFDKLVSVVKAQVPEDLANSPDSNFRVSYSLNDKWFAAGNSVDQVNKFLAGGKNNSHAGVKKLAGHPGGMYVDLQRILKTSEAGVTDSTAKVVMAESIRMWEDVVATVGDYSNGTLKSHFEINLVDKNTNSLKQLNQYIDRLAATKKKAF